MPGYEYNGTVDCNVDFSTSNLVGKTAIVTGGSAGLGEAYVRALVEAGAYVCIGDVDEVGGKKITEEFPDKVTFSRCNTTIWEDQVGLFEAAASFSPSGKIHYVVANAGITRPDDVFDNSNPELTKPSLATIDVNIYGALYTIKLATHYFMKQNGHAASDQQDDTCLILISSGAGFVDVNRTPLYCASKWAMRGVMHAMRRTAYHYGSRINIISPWYVRTKILPEEFMKEVESFGVEIARAEDGGQCLLRVLSDPSINGHNFFISARRWAPRGYFDLPIEDYPDNELLQEIQRDQIVHQPAEKGLFV